MCEASTVPSRKRSRAPISPASSSPKAVKTYYRFINFCSLCRLTNTNEEIIEFCQHFGLLPKSVICKSCGAELTKTKSRDGRLEFPCFKRQCRKNFSAKKCTWFENRRVSMRKCLILTYLFVSKTDVKSAVRETSGPDFNFETTSIETVVDFFRQCREVCKKSLFESEIPEKLGGTNFIVEIDKTKFGKHWVLGGICRETEECFFVLLEDYSQDKVLPIIQQRLAKGTTIFTENWAGYKSLSEQGFQHYTVNIPKQFVNPKTGVNINLMKSQWWALKRSLYYTGYGNGASIDAHLAEYMWHRKNQEVTCKFTTFLKDIVRLYPGQ